MKIAFFANTDWYLYNFRLELARYLRRQGHEVVMISPPGRYSEKIQAAGFRWLGIDLKRRSLSPGAQVSSVITLSKLFKREQISIVHNFTLKCVILGSAAARLAGVSAIVNAVAGLGYLFTSKDTKARILAPFMRIALSLTCRSSNTRVIVQNMDDAAVLEALGKRVKERVRVIYGSGVDTERFKPSATGHPQEQDSLRDTSRRIRILMIGRLLYDKGVREYVQAAELLARQNNLKDGVEYSFILAGDADPGNPASVDDRTLALWKMQAVVRFLGHVDDVRQQLLDADIVVLPSYREGLPKSLIEAAACAKPLVTSNVPGCNEVVVDGHNGILVPDRDAHALAAAIEKLSKNNEMRLRMGRSGRQRVLELFDQRIINESTYSTYLELLPVNGASRPESFGSSAF